MATAWRLRVFTGVRRCGLLSAVDQDGRRCRTSRPGCGDCSKVGAAAWHASKPSHDVLRQSRIEIAQIGRHGLNSPPPSRVNSPASSCCGLEALVLACAAPRSWPCRDELGGERSQKSRKGRPIASPRARRQLSMHDEYLARRQRSLPARHSIVRRRAAQRTHFAAPYSGPLTSPTGIRHTSGLKLRILAGRRTLWRCKRLPLRSCAATPNRAARKPRLRARGKDAVEEISSLPHVASAGAAPAREWQRSRWNVWSRA